MPAAPAATPIIVATTVDHHHHHHHDLETINDDELLLLDNDLKSISPSPPTPKQLADTRDSISSIDSDVSLSFDHDDHSPSTINTTNNNDDDDKIITNTTINTTSVVDQDEGAHMMADLSSDSASDTGSTGGGKDSGCEVTPSDLMNEPPPFAIPSDELADKIVQQVEFYFSDTNITKDAFLLKHVKRNKEGFVSLKLISSFKRVKHLTKDWRVVAHALERSVKLEINEAGTKLRRLDALPRYDETTPSRTVVAVHMPLEQATIESVAELFRECGEIALIRILRPGNPIPADVRQFINKNPSLAGVVCALVEFVVSESARKALQMQRVTTINRNNDDGGGEAASIMMRVYELNNIPHPERKKKSNAGLNTNNKKVSSSSSSSDYYTTSCQSSSETDDNNLMTNKTNNRFKLRRGSSANFPTTTLNNNRYNMMEPAAWLQRRLSASSTEANFIYMPRRLSYNSCSSSRDSSDSNLFLPRRMSSCCSITNNDNNNFNNNRRFSSSSQTSEYSTSGSSNPSRSRSNSSAFQPNENIVRLPRGPDGSKGFLRQQTASRFFVAANTTATIAQ